MAGAIGHNEAIERAIIDESTWSNQFGIWTITSDGIETLVHAYAKVEPTADLGVIRTRVEAVLAGMRDVVLLH